MCLPYSQGPRPCWDLIYSCIWSSKESAEKIKIWYSSPPVQAEACFSENWKPLSLQVVLLPVEEDQGCEEPAKSRWDICDTACQAGSLKWYRSSGRCGPNPASLLTFPCGSDRPAPFWLFGKLPWYPGFVSSLDELEHPNLSFYVHIGSTVAAGMLGSALVHLQFRSSVLHPLENF